MQPLVAEPVVATWVAKTGFVLCPRTIEGAVPVVLLDQQRRAVGYRVQEITLMLALRFEPSYQSIVYFLWQHYCWIRRPTA